MALTYTPEVSAGTKAYPFELLGTDDKIHRLTDFEDAKVLVLIFMCNHCPYVQAVLDRIESLYQEFHKKGVAVVGINPNDSQKYPEDGFEKMKALMQSKKYSFTYLWDETQNVAKQYGAVCTPDFFAYQRGEVKGSWSLSYRGRLDDSWKDPSLVTERSLAESIELLLNKKPITKKQIPSMGCSIKWK